MTGRRSVALSLLLAGMGAIASSGSFALAASSPAVIAPATPGSPVDEVGQLAIKLDAGRTSDQVLNQATDSTDPLDILHEPLLRAAGVSSFDGGEYDSLADGQIAVSRAFVEPYYTESDPSGTLGASGTLGFTETPQTPAVFEFAFRRGGTCFGGYATGYPVPNAVYAVDMEGQDCTERTVSDAIVSKYLQMTADTMIDAPDETIDAPDTETLTPDAISAPADNSAAPTDDTTTKMPEGSGDKTAAPVDNAGASDEKAAPADDAVFDGIHASDSDLEQIAYGAYIGAYNQAVKHSNYFSSDDLNYSDLRAGMRAALEKSGYGAAIVSDQPSDAADAAKACATDGAIDVRVAFNDGGIGISVAAVSAARMAAYEYLPDESSDIRISHTGNCLGATVPAASAGAAVDRLSTPAH